MKINLIIAAILLILVGTPAVAQTTATPTVTGKLSTQNCPSGSTVCYRQDWLYNNITTNTTTEVATGAGTFHGICINSAGSTSTVTIYDNTAASGNKIGTVGANAEGCFYYDAHFSTGLTVVTTGSPDITVMYN
jgi:hypothetical protein